MAAGAGLVVVLAAAVAYWQWPRSGPAGRAAGQQRRLATAAAAAVPASGPTTSPVPPTAAAESVPFYAMALMPGGRPDGFSTGRVELTRKGDRPMLGRFGERGVTFSVDGLPRHEDVHIVIDLALLNSWNGSNAHWGCDAVDVIEGDGRPLMIATFSNCGFFNNNDEQTFPDQVPVPGGAEAHAAWTGSVEHMSLGEMRHFAGMPQSFERDCSSVYHLEWTFPHTADNLVLQLSTHCDKDQNLKFGILDCKVDPVAHAPAMSAQQMTAAYAALNDDDPVKANAALWQLAATGDAAVDLIARQPTPTVPSPWWTGRVNHLLAVIGTPAAAAVNLPTP